MQGNVAEMVMTCAYPMPLMPKSERRPHCGFGQETHNRHAIFRGSYGFDPGPMVPTSVKEALSPTPAPSRDLVRMYGVRLVRKIPELRHQQVPPPRRVTKSVVAGPSRLSHKLQPPVAEGSQVGKHPVNLILAQTNQRAMGEILLDGQIRS